MRLTLLAIFLFLTGYATAQPFKPTPGNIKWLGEQLYTDTIYVDTALYNVANGLYLRVDTTGSSSTGYYTVVLDSTSGGDVLGSGASLRVPYWSSSNTLSSLAGITVDAGSQSLVLSGFAALTVQGENKNITLSNASGTETDIIYKSADNLVVSLHSTNGFVVETSMGEAMNISNGGDAIFNPGFRSGMSFYVYADTDTALTISPTADGAIGIHTNAPQTPLHIKGSGANEVLLTLENNELGTPGAGAGTITDLPNDATAGNPAYVKVVINGKEGYLLFYELSSP